MRNTDSRINESSMAKGKTMEPENIFRILEKHNGDRGEIISVLEDIQRSCGYLPEDALRVVAKQTARSLVDLYGVATFYRSFSLKPRGNHLLSVCSGTACHVRNGLTIVEEFERQLKIKAGETTPDKEISLETVNCLGACALGPIVVLDGHYFSNVDTTKVKEILKRARTGVDRVDVKGDHLMFSLDLSCPRCHHRLMDPIHRIDGHPSIRMSVSFEQRHGDVWLSSLYGSDHMESEVEVPTDTVTHFFCPHCHAEITSLVNCIECDAPMVPMIVSGGGTIQICSRHGCREHWLDLNGGIF